MKEVTLIADSGSTKTTWCFLQKIRIGLSVMIVPLYEIINKLF